MNLRHLLTCLALAALLTPAANAGVIKYSGGFSGDFISPPAEIAQISGTWTATVTDAAFESARQDSINSMGNSYLYVGPDSLTFNPAAIGSRTIGLGNTEFALRFINGILFDYYFGATFVNTLGVLIRADDIAAPDDFRVTYRNSDFSELYTPGIITQIAYRVGSGTQRDALTTTQTGGVEVQRIAAVPIANTTLLLIVGLFCIAWFTGGRQAMPLALPRYQGKRSVA
jgi:hypothetical protein